MSELIEILNAIPGIILLILPGLVFIVVFNFICKRDNSESLQSKFGIVILSYIISLPFDYINKSLNINNTLIVLIVSCITSVILGLLWARIYSSDWFNNKLLRGFLHINRSTRNQFIEDVLDYKDGMYVRLFIKDKPIVIFGVLLSHGDTSSDNYFLVGNYSLYKFDGESFVKELWDNTEEDNKKIIVNMSEVYLIECEYKK